MLRIFSISISIWRCIIIIIAFITFQKDYTARSYDDFYDQSEADDDDCAVRLNFGNFQFVIRKNNLSLPQCRAANFGRLVNGRNADDDEYPFAALLLRHQKPFGGAAIIARQWIITAAHNFHSSNESKDFAVGVGSIHLEQLRVYRVAKIIFHPMYVRKQKFDIALLKLREPLRFGATIKPICLPQYSFEPINSNHARVVGWGYPKFRLKQVSPILQEVDLEIISLERCRTLYAALQQDIIRSQICTWTLNKDACSGDSGGPLFVYNDNREAILYGIVSFGVTCADEFPGVYTAISYYLNWISKIMREN